MCTLKYGREPGSVTLKFCKLKKLTTKKPDFSKNQYKKNKNTLFAGGVENGFMFL